MFSEHLGVLNNVLAVFDVKNSAIKPGEFLDDPGNFRCTNPGVGIRKLLLGCAINQVNKVLNLWNSWNCKQIQFLLESKP